VHNINLCIWVEVQDDPCVQSMVKGEALGVASETASSDAIWQATDMLLAAQELKCTNTSICRIGETTITTPHSVQTTSQSPADLISSVPGHKSEKQAIHLSPKSLACRP
jgi:hypothetical protein